MEMTECHKQIEPNLSLKHNLHEHNMIVGKVWSCQSTPWFHIIFYIYMFGNQILHTCYKGTFALSTRNFTINARMVVAVVVVADDGAVVASLIVVVFVFVGALIVVRLFT